MGLLVVAMSGHEDQHVDMWEGMTWKAMFLGYIRKNRGRESYYLELHRLKRKSN